MPEGFSDIECAALFERLTADEPLACPRCHVPLDRREVLPRTDVSYVRDRVWVTCPSCHRSAVLDRRESR